ncbi:olfactory receptor-like protein I9 [Xenopus laevis]|uniref:Olfactory receptor n=2 Tax=Xenopus laevis TaxID=8355 RepID=A0A974DFA9_XENLA|nr:olfactory receptor-like protein I9 [Xenopus laevis]OCT90879.1 hypothetical protein XELAEV_18019496mg [Xenopus laevis]
MCSLISNKLNDTNETKVTYFFLLGINGPQTLKIFLFSLFLGVHIATLCGNIMLIALYLKSQHLKTPMYFFLSHLSFSDILLSICIVPNLLDTLLKNGKSMSLTSCLAQLLATGTSTGAECYLLTAMSYDRYMAICNPLGYMKIMNNKLCVHLVAWSWFLSFLICLVIVLQIAQLEFCRCNILDYIYCDFSPLLAISCKNSFALEITTMVLSVPIILLPFWFIISTYICIGLAIFRISSNVGRQKAFSTCSSHLTVVCTYCGILITKYTVPIGGQSITMNKVISLLYTVGTPLLNPIIYSFRNQEIRAALNKWMTRRV